MSGELQIVFIYDTLSCRKEEDDPREAILYFHPADIAEERRIAICGQLMGIAHFLVESFAAPKILTLENGKFALREFGKQYVLALGCSSITPDWLLEKQADILYHLTRFFHRDIHNILTNVNDDRHLLSAKLSTMMDHYIPISQHHGDLFALTFGILPILYLPKSANNISLNATLILQTCILKKGVLGGIVMYQNKVVGVELGQDLAQKLAFIQPYQLPVIYLYWSGCVTLWNRTLDNAWPAEPVKIDFNLPSGVQLFTVYVSQKELYNLRKHSSVYQYPSQFEPCESNAKENRSSKIDSIREEDPSVMSSSTGFSESSFLFSEETLTFGTNLSTNSSTSDKETIKIESIPSKPNDVENSYNRSILFKSKQLLDMKDDDGRKDSIVSQPDNSHQPCLHRNGCHSNLMQFSRHFRSMENISFDTEKFDLKTNFSTSLTDPFFPFFRCDGKSVSKFLLEAYSDNAKLNDTSKNEESLWQSNDTTQNHPEPIHSPSLTISKPIASSTLVQRSPPVSNGIPEVSSTYTSVRRPMDLQLNTATSLKPKTKYRRWSTYDDMMSPAVETPSQLVESIKLELNLENDSEVVDEKTKESEIVPQKINDSSHKRLLTSFKKLSNPDDSSSFYSPSDNELTTSSQENKVSSSTATSFHNKHLLNNLTKVNVERSSKFGQSKSHPKRESDKKNQNSNDIYESSSLFIYSLGSMRLLLLLDTQYLVDSSLIHSLWRYASACMADMESSVSSVEEQSMSMGTGHTDHYCYLHFEPVWKSLAHGGRNHSMDFDIVQLMHQDFSSYPNINELIIRGEDHVVYGYHCVGSEVFYQQSAGLQPGLPMPTDLMGKVPLKAKRRLERDHNILLL